MDETNTMTDSEIISEFEDLFGASQPEEEPEPESQEESEDVEEESTDEEPSEEETDEEEEASETEDEESSKKQKKSDDNLKKQREAFYKMRTQNKSYEKLFNRLGKLFNLTDSDDADEVVKKIEEAVLQKEAQKENVPVEIMKRLQELESIVNQKETNDRENRVTTDLAKVGEKYGLDEDSMEAFLLELANDGKNPLEIDVDLETEYIKRHYEELLEAAKNAALEQEAERKDKVKDKAASGLPAKKDKSGSATKIETMEDLDSWLDSL